MAGPARHRFVVGLAGGVHCMAMCGGIVAALNFRADPAGPASLRVIAARSPTAPAG